MYILTMECEYTVENYNGTIEPYKCFQREEEVYDIHAESEYEYEQFIKDNES